MVQSAQKEKKFPASLQVPVYKKIIKLQVSPPYSEPSASVRVLGLRFGGSEDGPPGSASFLNLCVDVCVHLPWEKTYSFH